jgi:protein-S-isoprenylcysteine O-methyltransferase Ste14
MNNTILGIAWVLYFFVHSFLASTATKSIIQKKSPFLFTYYRILYNLIAIGGLIPLLIQSVLSPDAYLFAGNLVAGISVTVIGLVFLYVAFRAFDGAEFLGIKAEEKPKLVQKGMYRHVRHPLYFATIILILGLFLLIPTEKMGLVLVISYSYIQIGYRLEESKLIAVFGPEYTTYQKRVKALIPYLY